MNKLVCITGHTRGLGKELADIYTAMNFDVKGFSRSNGYHIEKDIDKIVNESVGCDLFINNTYADGHQLALMRALLNKVPRMVVMGSIVTDYPDEEVPHYNADKLALEKMCSWASNHHYNTQVLLLTLTGSSYTNTKLIKQTIDFWYNCPSITQVKFNTQ